MIRKIKKTNFILSLLVIAFFIVSLSLILEMQIPSEIIPDQPTIIEEVAYVKYNSDDIHRLQLGGDLDMNSEKE